VYLADYPDLVSMSGLAVKALHVWIAEVRLLSDGCCSGKTDAADKHSNKIIRCGKSTYAPPELLREGNNPCDVSMQPVMSLCAKLVA
jgi:hypothetical protein